MIVYTHSDCLLKFNGPGHPERKERLDVYEDYPKLYIKKYFKYKNKKIMFYYMKKKTSPVKPRGYYFKVMKNGYRQNNFKFIDI